MNEQKMDEGQLRAKLEVRSGQVLDANKHSEAMRQRMIQAERERDEARTQLAAAREENRRLREAVREHMVDRPYQFAGGPVGGKCRVCKQTWEYSRPEVHNVGCPAALAAPSEPKKE